MFVANAVSALAVLLGSVLGRSPMMLSQMLLQLLLPTVITACCGKKAMFLQHCKTVLSGPSE